VKGEAVQTPLRIAIADDHALFRQGLKSQLRLRPGLVVVAEIERADQLLSAITASPCDILLLDLQMERSSLVDIKGLSERVAVIVVTASERAEDALAAIRSGARAVVFKRFAIETLMDAVAAVVDGNVWFPPALQKHLTARLDEPAEEALTPRETEIAKLVAIGLRNAEVAARLAISEVTVKTHLNNIFQKLGLRGRTALALYAIRMGLVGVQDRDA
jgi:two-component system NarL family response regulator